MITAQTESITREQLATKSSGELKDLAKRMNIKHHPNIKDTNLIEKICQQPQAVVYDSMKHVAAQVAAPVFDNTEQEVLEAIRPLMREGFEAKFPGDGTWLFKYKGREESGNMKIPLRVIKLKAENVARGALRLRTINLGDGELIAG